MRKTIVFVSVFVVFLMVITPAISAIEFQNVKESVELKIENQKNTLSDLINILKIITNVTDSIWDILLALIASILLPIAMGWACLGLIFFLPLIPVYIFMPILVLLGFWDNVNSNLMDAINSLYLLFFYPLIKILEFLGEYPNALM